MSVVPIAWLAMAALLIPSRPVSGESIEIDLPTALARARERSAAAIAARGEVAVAEGAVTAAGLAFIDNPEVEVGAGPRWSGAPGAGTALQAEVRLVQSLELGRRGPRRELARAGVAQRQAEASAALRAIDLEVASAFYDAVLAARSADLAAHGEELAQRAAEAADRRRKAGEITDLDANLARGALGRARAAGHAARAERAQAIGRLGALIGAGPDDAIAVRGELEAVAPLDPAALRAQAASRPDVRAFDAERAVAAAERDQAEVAALPQLALWASYQREDTEAVVLGGLRVALPVWNRGQGERQAAAARERRAIASREATLRAAERQIADAVAAHGLASAAVDAFERDVLPVLDDSEQLLQKAIAAGQIAVSDYLVARQEILDGRREHLERLVARARAGAAVRFAAAGGSP
jgi:cobalt-zinc-cadmium efflux system outer membrane protein